MPRTRRNLIGAYNPPYELRPSTLAARNATAIDYTDYNCHTKRRMPRVRLPRLCMPMDVAYAGNSRSYLHELRMTQAAAAAGGAGGGGGSRKQRNTMAEMLARLYATRSAVVLHRNPRFKSGTNTRSTLACTQQSNGGSGKGATTTASNETPPTSKMHMHDAAAPGAVAMRKRNSVQVIDSSSDNGSSNETNNSARSRRMTSTPESSTTSGAGDIDKQIVAKLNSLQSHIKEIKQLASRVQQSGKNSGRRAHKTKPKVRTRRRLCPTFSTLLMDVDALIKNMPKPM